MKWKPGNIIKQFFKEKKDSRDYLEIGSAPAEESCAQVGQDYYREISMIEMKQYIKAIRRELGPEPEKARLGIKSFQHDFGTYYEVVCYYDNEDEESLEYAFKCEASAPTQWSKEDKQEIRLDIAINLLK